jgi:hypothetical protein
MTHIDLSGADWNRIDGHTLFMLEDHEKLPNTSFSGTTADFVAKRLEEGRFSDRKVPFLIQIKKEDGSWPEKEIPGLVLYSRIGNILAARGDIHAVVALAKDSNVVYVEASRPGFQE